MSTNKFILADFEEWDTLKPITLTRSIADIRIGILTIKEKWERWLLNDVGILTQSYLQPKYALPKGDDFIYINASIIPNEQLIEDILSLKENYTLVTESGLPIASFAEKVFSDPKQLIDGPIFKTKTPLDQINHCWDIFTLNGKEIEDKKTKLKTDLPTIEEKKKEILASKIKYEQDGTHKFCRFCSR